MRAVLLFTLSAALILLYYKRTYVQSTEHEVITKSTHSEQVFNKYQVLVTGAAGFIGFHTSTELQKRGHFVVGVDNMNTYYSPKLKAERVRRLISSNITFLRQDVCDEAKLALALNYFDITHVIHLAAQAGVRYSLDHPIEYTKNNIECFVRLLEVMKLKNISLIYASSSSVYGTNSKIPFEETDAVDRPASLYAASKRSDELIARTYNSLYGLKSIGLRFFTVYGPWGRPDMALFTFVRDIIDGRVIKLFSHGNLRRDFTYIDDIVDGIVRCLSFDGTVEVFNLGNNKPIALRRFLSIIEESVGIQAKVKYVGAQLGDVPVTYAGISKAADLLGYSPKTSLETGIPAFVRWYNETYLPMLNSSSTVSLMCHGCTPFELLGLDACCKEEPTRSRQTTEASA